jgi:hypothetical protein
MVQVDSPIAGALFIARVIAKSEQNPSWKKAWEIFWDSLDSSLKKLVPKVQLPTIYFTGFRRVSSSSLDSENDQTRAVGQLLQQQVFSDLRGDRHLTGDGNLLFNTILNYLGASRSVNGILSWAFTGMGVECHPPTVMHTDDRRRAHNEHGPAIEYSDGWKLYAWHGARVPENAILSPETITVAQIENHPNAEVRRILIDRMGPLKYAEESNATEIGRDHFGVLLRKDVIGAEPIVMVRVVNSTPEPDGHFKTYHLRVHPNCRTAREGVAWTFGMSADEYDPKIES